MSWGSAFAAALRDRNRAPVFLLRVLQGAPASGTSTGYSPPGYVYTVSSASGYGYPVHIGHGLRVSGSRVSPVSWRYQIGSWDVDLVGDLSALHDASPRGAMVAVDMGFAGWDEADFERVAVGAFDRIDSEGIGPGGARHVFRAWDVGSLLATRFAEDSAKGALFHSAGSSTTIPGGGSYTPGVSTVIQVTDSSVFERRTTGAGVVVCTPTGGSSFYLTYTGTTTGTPDTLTGVSVVGKYGTAATPLAAGDEIANAALLIGHPIDMALETLISGNGTASPYEVFPDPRGWRVPLDLVDTTDAASQAAALTPATGSLSWEVVVTTGQQPAWSWLQGLLGIVGIWVVQRQGKLTARFAQPRSSPSVAPCAGITTADLLGTWRLVTWDGEQPIEYGAVRAYGPTMKNQSGAGSIHSMPVQTYLDIDIGDRVWSNESAILDEALDRLAPWAGNVVERIRLPLALWASELCPGDLVVVDLPIKGRLLATRDGYSSQICMVAAVSPDFSGGVVDVELVTYDHPSTVSTSSAALPASSSTPETLPTARTITAADSPYTQRIGDERLLVNASGGAVTVALISTATADREMRVKKIDASGNAVTITGAGDDLLDGAASVSLAAQWDSVGLFPDSAAEAWRVWHLSPDTGGGGGGGAAADDLNTILHMSIFA